MGYNSTKDFLKLVDGLADECQLTKDKVNSLLGYVKSIYQSEVESRYNATMFWIGMYIALASVVCILAMVADLLHGFHTRKLWFPCKYFRLNSAFLSVIPIAMKLPMDLGGLPGDVDQVTKLGSMAFMCTMMANLLPCLATMESNDLFSNITALFILVITLVVNVCIQIQIQTGVVSYQEAAQMLKVVLPNYEVKISKHRNTTLATIYVTLLLVLLMLHLSSSLPTLKLRKDIKNYLQRHEKDTRSIANKLLTFEQLQKHVTRYLVMEETGIFPQVITTCYCTTSASGVICVLVTILHAITMSSTVKAIFTNDYDSDYGWSTIVILIVQSIGVVIGTIAPLSRCFATLSFKVMSFEIISKHFKVFEVESYWTEKLHEWKRAKIYIPSPILNAVIMTLKKLILIFCIKFQEGVVVVCNIIALIPFIFMICFSPCFRCWKRSMFTTSSEEWTLGWTVNLERTRDLLPYVALREDKIELILRTLKGLLKSLELLVWRGGEPINLVRLIKHKATDGFHGVKKFVHTDHHRIPSLLSEVHEYPDCWSLAVVTLTTIAVSLPGIEKNEVERLLRSVREGLVYVTLVEKSLNVTDEYKSIQKVAEILWTEVDVYRKWLGHKLQVPVIENKTAGQIVEWFSDTANTIYQVVESNGGGNEDSIHICAKSMYRITKTILLSYNENIEKANPEELFDNLSSMIADIIAACLTNIPQVIVMKCHTSAIEKRKASVNDAARLLGETKRIIETIQRYHIPHMSPYDFPFLDKWGYNP
ncbi:hypothetical protein SSX86_009882 [Deinandra increscens subsp. villosa]|uniref:Uncharacterized protein n=1 Tax=Deinandra increscens subsp. villosa TaxID=3103831 RepID=A0AAP0DAG5_9ASTR